MKAHGRRLRKVVRGFSRRDPRAAGRVRSGERANVGEVCNLALGRLPERGRCRASAAFQSEIANLAYVAASVLAGGPGVMALGRRLRIVARESLRGFAFLAKRHLFFRAASPVVRCREGTRELLSQACLRAFPETKKLKIVLDSFYKT